MAQGNKKINERNKRKHAEKAEGKREKQSK